MNKITLIKFVLPFTHILFGFFLIACGTPPPTRDVNESEEKRAELESSLRSQGYSEKLSEQMSREYFLKQGAKNKAFSSELRHQKCWTNALLMTECNLEYLNQLQIQLVCQGPKDKTSHTNTLMSELSRRPARFLPFEWKIEGMSGSAQTEGDGKAGFSYKVSRTMVVREVPTSDPSPSKDLRIKGKHFDLNVGIESSVEILTVSIPEHACKASANALPKEVTTFIDRRLTCNQMAIRRAESDSQTTSLDAEFAKNRCTSVATDEIELMRKYKKNPSVLHELAESKKDMD